MSRLDRLLEVGTMTDSLGVYVPAMAVRHIVSLARHMLFMYLTVSVGEFGLWTIGWMIFNIGAQLITLGSSHGLTRYVSFYEARGRIRAFYRRIRWVILLACVTLTAVAVFGADVITDLVISCGEKLSAASYAHQRLICLAAIGNALVMALYVNMLSFMHGMRVYRLAALVELASNLLFTVLGVAALAFAPTALAILGAHALAIGAAFLVGMVILHGGLSRLSDSDVAVAQAAERSREVVLVPPPQDDGAGAAVPAPHEVRGEQRLDRPWAPEFRVFKFGIVALASGLVWQFLPYISLVMTQREYGESVSGVYGGLMRFTQPVHFIGAAVLMVVFSHVARLWESGRVRTAVSVLETSYKALVVVLMTVAVLTYTAAGLWMLILPGKYRGTGLSLVGGQLMFFQTMIQLSLMHMIARLRERPMVIGLVALVAAGANVVLARWWMPQMGVCGAARAAGVGVFIGGGAVSAAYLLLSGVKLRTSTYLFLAAPALLLLPSWAAGPLWLVLLLLTKFTGLLLSKREKILIRAQIGKTWRVFRSTLPWH